MPPGFDPYPLLLFALGMFTLFVLIIRLKVHAFLALIGAALLVGLLSPRVILQTRELDSYQKLQRDVNSRLADRNVEQVRKAYQNTSKGIPQGDEVASSTQSRKVLRNPCTVISNRSMRRSSMAIAIGDNGRPILWPGNT